MTNTPDEFWFNPYLKGTNIGNLAREFNEIQIKKFISRSNCRELLEKCRLRLCWNSGLLPSHGTYKHLEIEATSKMRFFLVWVNRLVLSEEIVILDFADRVILKCVNTSLTRSWEPKKQIEEVKQSMVLKNRVPEEGSTSNDGYLIVPELDLDFNALYFNPNPVYITDLTDGSMLFANPQALTAQQKNLPDLLRTAAALDNPEDLAYRTKLLCEVGGTGRLTDFEYKGYRWFKEPDTGIYRLKEMNFVSFFARVSLFNTDCRLAITLSAEPTGKIL